MNNETKMLQEISRNVTLLEVKFQRASTLERAELRPSLEELLNEYARFRIGLLTNGVTTTEADLAEMREIRDLIDKAANKQSILFAIARTIGFLAARF